MMREVCQHVKTGGTGMDRDRFDWLSRRVAGASTRRDALRLILGGVVAGAVGVEAAAAKKAHRARSGQRGAVHAQQNEPTCPATCTANCSGKRLQGGANLTKCNFNDRDLDGVNLRGANLTNACFGDASLRDADLRATKVSGACFCGADLTGADFRGSNITKQQLACAIVSCTTILPNGKPATSCDCALGCPPGSVCELGGCQPCTVSCPSGDGVACGKELQRHIDADEQVIYICPGRYIGNFTIFAPRPSLTLIGAGDGDNPANSTILDGAQKGRVFLVPGEVSVSLVGMRVTNGSANPGGCLLNQGTLELADCTVDQCRASVSGGGVRNDGRLSVAGCTFSNNIAGGDPRNFDGGGGICNKGQLTTLTDSSFFQNKGGAFGGGLLNDGDGQTPITNCTFANNDAERGGGIFNSAGIVLKHTAITGPGTGIPLSRIGAGLHNVGTAVFDRDCRVTGNIAFETGGGIFNVNFPIDLNGATVTGNTPNNCAGPARVNGCKG
jgi:hypothetical protein